MTVRDIREKAKELKVKGYGKLSKEQLIWAVQLAEGNTDCYGKIQGCGLRDCCWWEDCQV